MRSPSMVTGKASIGRGAGPWMIWPYRLEIDPGNGAAQVGALPPQGQETLRHPGQPELTLGYLLDVADVELLHRPGRDYAAEAAGPTRPEEAEEAVAPARDQRDQRAPAGPAQR